MPHLKQGRTRGPIELRVGFVPDPKSTDKYLASMQMHLRHAAKCYFLAFSALHDSSLEVVDGHSWPCMVLCDQGNGASQPVVQSWTGICRAPE